MSKFEEDLAALKQERDILRKMDAIKNEIQSKEALRSDISCAATKPSTTNRGLKENAAEELETSFRNAETARRKARAKNVCKVLIALIIVIVIAISALLIINFDTFFGEESVVAVVIFFIAHIIVSLICIGLPITIIWGGR